MKILNKTEFLKLPPGVAYAKGGKWFFDGLCFKEDTIPKTGDWWYTDPVGTATPRADEGTPGSYSDPFDLWETMLTTGVSADNGMDELERDGLYEDDDLFLVFERRDLRRLRDMVENALAVSWGGFDEQTD